MEEKLYYLILSTGAYSDYSPSYHSGKLEVTKEELDEKAKEICAQVYKRYDELPSRKEKPCTIEHEHFSICSDGTQDEKFISETGESFWPHEIQKWFWEEMYKFVEEKGFLPLPDDIPEINISYSDLPYDKEGNQI